MNPAFGLLLGIAFGAVLATSGLSDPRRIVAMLRLRDLFVLKLLVTALAVGIVGAALLDEAGLAHLKVKPIHVAANLLGGVLFRTMDLTHGTAEAGCWLEPSAAGRGLVTRAARRIIDWAVEERGVHRVEWHASSANEASIAVARRLDLIRKIWSVDGGEPTSLE